MFINSYIKNGKKYFRLVRSYRDSNGKVKHQSFSLGTEPRISNANKLFKKDRQQSFRQSYKNKKLSIADEERIQRNIGRRGKVLELLDTEGILKLLLKYKGLHSSLEEEYKEYDKNAHSHKSEQCLQYAHLFPLNERIYCNKYCSEACYETENLRKSEVVDSYVLLLSGMYYGPSLQWWEDHNRPWWCPIHWDKAEKQAREREKRRVKTNKEWENIFGSKTIRNPYEVLCLLVSATKKKFLQDTKCWLSSIIQTKVEIPKNSKKLMRLTRL